MLQLPLRKDQWKDHSLVIALVTLVAGVMPLGPIAGHPLAAQQSDGP